METLKLLQNTPTSRCPIDWVPPSPERQPGHPLFVPEVAREFARITRTWPANGAYSNPTADPVYRMAIQWHIIPERHFIYVPNVYHGTPVDDTDFSGELDRLRIAMQALRWLTTPHVALDIEAWPFLQTGADTELQQHAETKVIAAVNTVRSVFPGSIVDVYPHGHEFFSPGRGWWWQYVPRIVGLPLNPHVDHWSPFRLREQFARNVPSRVWVSLGQVGARATEKNPLGAAVGSDDWWSPAPPATEWESRELGTALMSPHSSWFDSAPSRVTLATDPWRVPGALAHFVAFVEGGLR